MEITPRSFSHEYYTFNRDAEVFQNGFRTLGVEVESSVLNALEADDAEPFVLVDLGNGSYFLQLEAPASEREFSDYPDLLDTYLYNSESGELTEITEDLARRNRESGRIYTQYTIDDEVTRVTISPTDGASVYKAPINEEGAIEPGSSETAPADFVRFELYEH